MNVLIMTTEWPDLEHPHAAPFLVQHIRVLKSQGVNVEVFHFKGNRRIINYIKAWWEVRKTPFWSKAEILHAHWGQSAYLALFSKKKLVITYHGSDLQGIVKPDGNYSIKGKLLVLLSKLISNRANSCIVVSDHLRNILPKNLNHVFTIPLGINLQIFQPMDQGVCRKRLHLNQNRRYCLFISDPMRNEKRFWLAEQTLVFFNEAFPDCKSELLIVKGVDYCEIPLYMNAGDVLLLTSSHEGSPTIIKEALACNLPIVSTNVGDVYERIGKIEGCVVCDSDKPEIIAQALLNVLRSGKRIEGRKHILHLDEEIQSRKVYTIYQNIINMQL